MTKSSEKIKISTRFNSVPISTDHEKLSTNESANESEPCCDNNYFKQHEMITIDLDDITQPQIKLFHENVNNTDNNSVLPGLEITVTDNEISSSINETNTQLQDETQPNQHKLSINTSSVLTPNQNHFKIRHDSFKQFTERFRSFSIDLFRSIEMAHDAAELRNKKFSNVTQTAAAQMYSTTNETKQDDIVVIIDENELTPNHTPKPVLITCDDQDKSQSVSSNDKFSSSLSPHSRSKADSPFAKDLQNLNRNSIKNKMLYSDHLIASSLIKIDEKNEEFNGSSRTQIDQKDQIDYRIRLSTNKEIPDDIHISVWEVFIYMWGIITFFADLISDIILSAEYFNNSKFWLGFMTLMLVLVPNITLSLFSLSWYIDKHYSTQSVNNKKNTDLEQGIPSQSKPVSTCDSITFWITTVLFVIFQIDLIWKYIQGFIYTVKGWACRSLYKNLAWEKYYIEKQIKCDTDIGMLRLIDVFMDSGPQVLLQLYVITTQNLNESGSANLIVFTFRDFKTTSLEFKQFFSILSSLLSMGYALAGYQRCLRNQQFIFCLETNKPLPRPISWLSTIMQFLWYLFLIAPRVLSMAIFASTFRSWFFMIVFTHWLIMYFWILRLKTNYCISSPDEYSAREEIFEKFYDFVCSFIYIFVYFNLKSGSTRYRYLIYYIIFYSENMIFSISYFFFSKETNPIYRLSMLLIVIIGFWIAITFQIVYYLHCHPSHDIRVCVKDPKGGGCISITKKTLNKRFDSTHLDDSSSSAYRLNLLIQPINHLTNNDSSTLRDASCKTNQDNLSSAKLDETNIINYNDIKKEEIINKERSLFSLSSTSSDFSPFSSVFNLSQSNLVHNSSNIKNSFQSKSTMSLTEKLTKESRFILDDFYGGNIKENNKINLNDDTYLQQTENAPLASIKEFSFTDNDDDDSVAKDFNLSKRIRHTSLSSKNS